MQAGLKVDGIDIAAPPSESSEEWATIDVARDGLPAGLLETASTLVHLAWSNDPGRGNVDMAKDVNTNVAGAVRTFEQAARAGVPRILYPSSGGTIYGKSPEIPTPESAPVLPVGGYGAGKAAAEFYLHAIRLAYGTTTCSLRIGNPYGPGQFPNRGQGFIATAVARTLSGQPIQIFGSDELSRDYIYIDDVAESFVQACMADKLPTVLNVGSGESLTLKELVPLIFDAVGKSAPVEHLPGRAVDVPRVQLDIRLIRQCLNWNPRTSIEDGLRTTVEWIRQCDQRS